MDLHNENQQEPELEGITRMVPPANSPADGMITGRRRRTERFAGLIDEADAQPVEDAPAEPKGNQGASGAPQGTRVNPTVRAGEHPSAVGTNRVPTQVPSQGVPRPTALGGQRPVREENDQPLRKAPTVRRPVQAEGYAPLQQLGTPARPRRPEAERTGGEERPLRARTPEAEYAGYEIQPMEEAERKGSGRGLIALIIALLVLAALILGLMMIPEEDTGVLGSVKRAVTAPIRRLIDGEEENAVPAVASASDFKATISQSTAPYKIVFHMVTTSNVTAVRVVDEQGAVMPTTTTLSTPSSENTVVWMLEMLLEGGFSGNVTAQIQNGEKWMDTGLWQLLSLGGTTPPIVTDGPAANSPSAAVSTTAAPTETPFSLPVTVMNTVTPVPEGRPTETPAPTGREESAAAGTPAVTATPTLSVTATPTLMPTATPTAAPTEAPTEMPTVEPEPEPTATPTPAPAATPLLEAQAVESADPSLISETVIYKDGKKVTSYQREKPMNMPAADQYIAKDFGVLTFRGNAFRQNAAAGTVEKATSLSLEWTVEAGSVAGSTRTYYGIGWTGQPVIVKWAMDVRRSMELDQDRKDQKNLKEVIVAGMDGRIYFLDLVDGSVTREAINFGYPMRSTPSLNPLGYPLMTVGQYARKMKSGTSDEIGLYYYNLVNRKTLRMIDGIDRKLKRPYSENASGAFDTSALVDRTTNTLIAIGTNGLLYTERLTMSMQVDTETSSVTFAFDEPKEAVTMMSHTKNQKAANVAVESSLAMYGSYAYYADMGGVLRCVDTTTMTTAWAVETGDAVRAAIALDLEEGEDANTLWLYTANLVNNARTKGDVTIRRYNAMTGEEDWAFAIHCADGKKKDVTFNAIVTPGAMASPAIGQNGLSDLVYFTLSSVSATGAKTLSENEALAGVIIALNKATGEVVWHKAMDAYCYASPVAVYDQAGKGWIIQACSNGTILLLDGLTGKEINTLQVNGVIEGSPAVYGDMMVIGTTGKDTSYIYGIRIK